MTVDTSAPTRQWGSPHLRGHVLLFDRQAATPASPRAGVQLLLGAVAVEVVRLAAVRWLYPGIPLTLLIPLLLVLGLLVPVIAGVDFSQVGLRRWCDWTPTEKSYFLQVIVLANVIFPIALGARLAQPVTAASLSTVVVPYLFFGFYQELVYRAGGPVISGWSESFMRSETPISPGASDPVGDSPTQTAHRAS